MSVDRLPWFARGEEAVPRFFTERDHPWLRGLLDEYDRFVGRQRHELDARLKELRTKAMDIRAQRVAERVLDRVYATAIESAVEPALLRRELFAAATVSTAPRRDVVASIAAKLGAPPAQLAEALFADIPSMRRVRAPEQPRCVADLALAANGELVRSLMFCAERVVVRARDQSRLVVRHAKLCGLICSTHASGSDGAFELDISGPFSLFRRTLVYGRALAQLVPLVAWTTEFEMRCTCELGGRSREIVLRSGDPIRPSRPPRRYDSKLEERFAREFRRAAPDCELLREPEPVVVRGAHIFPDFAIVRRGAPARRWLLEIVGYWTREYLERKLASLRAAGLTRLILCLDADRNCGADELPKGAQVIRFRKRIDPGEVLRAMC